MRPRSLKRALSLRYRRIWFPRWRRRLLFLGGGLAVGGLAILMAWAADSAQDVFHEIVGIWPYAPFVLTPAGFALAAWLTRRYFPNAQGSGIPQVIAARQLPDTVSRYPLVAPRLAVGKILLLCLGLACGASAGREGPTVQVGASAMFFLGRFWPHRQPGLLIAGSAAGVAAAFNAPLAGIVFGIEEMSRSFELRTSGLVISTVIAAGLTALALTGNYAYFGSMGGSLPIGPHWLVLVAAAAVCGLAGGAFSRFLIAMADGLPGAAGRLVSGHPVLFAAACGLALALCGLMSDGQVFGTGYEQARDVLHGNDTLSPGYAPLKLVATALSSISGIPGGLFSPSLAVGAGIGRDLSMIFTSVPLEVLGLLCMAAYLAGVVQAPITSFVIVSEMTHDHTLVIPLMLATLIATATSRMVCPEGVYHALAKRFLARSRPA